MEIYMGIMRKRLSVPIIIVLLLCAACTPGGTGPGPAVTPEQPSGTNQVPISPEAPSTATAPQPSATQGVSEPSVTETGKETGEPSSPPGTDGPSEQEDKTTTAPQESETPPASPDISQPAGPDSAAPTPSPADNGPIILTISGDAVDHETTWTLSRLQALRDGYHEITYSTTNNWPSFGLMEAHGVSIPYLLRQAGIKDNAASIKFLSTDGFHTTLTRDQVLGTLLTYADHSASGSSGASAVEPVVAWAWGDKGKLRPENIRPFFGQSGPWEVNTAAFVKDLCAIEVSAAPAGAWDTPGASIADGSTVSAETELELSHGNMDSVRIYYTTDGSEPDYNSPVYNPSASYFQPQLVKPLVLTESVTIKAFAAGLGRERSAVVSIAIAVE